MAKMVAALVLLLAASVVSAQKQVNLGKNSNQPIAFGAANGKRGGC